MFTVGLLWHLSGAHNSSSHRGSQQLNSWHPAPEKLCSCRTAVQTINRTGEAGKGGNEVWIPVSRPLFARWPGGCRVFRCWSTERLAQPDKAPLLFNVPCSLGSLISTSRNAAVRPLGCLASVQATVAQAVILGQARGTGDVGCGKFGRAVSEVVKTTRSVPITGAAAARLSLEHELKLL